MIKILIVDDHQLLLDGLSRILSDIPDLQIVGMALNGDDALKILEEQAPDVVLLDINMPKLNGVETCRRISKIYPKTKVIALSMYKRPSYITRMLHFGAMGYLLKDDSAQEIERAIRVVMQGDHYFSSQINVDYFSLLSQNNPEEFEPLSTREIEILECISQGLTNQLISEKLFLSQHTIETHRKNILRKLNAKNTADLIRISIERGLI